MTILAEVAYQQLQTMPEHLQKEALDFIEFIKQQNAHQQTLEVTSQEHSNKRTLGFMAGEGCVPDDINWGDDEVLAMFDEV